MQVYKIYSLGQGGWVKSNTIIYSIAYIWAICFLILPLIMILKISLSESALGQIPPYNALWSWGGLWKPILNVSFVAFQEILGENLYLQAYIFSFRVACISTLLALVISYPIALAISNLSEASQYRLLILILIPFWTSFLIRIYAWIIILKDKGILNKVLLSLQLVSEPLHILDTEWAVYIGMVYSYLPFMILPIYSSLSQIDKSLLEAANNLGCTHIQIFWKIILPLSIQGICTGCILVFIPVLSDCVITDILGGSNEISLGKSLWIVFFNQANWPEAAVIATLMIFLTAPFLCFILKQTN